MLPDGRAVVWIQDRTLGVLPVTPDGEVRVATARYAPLELPPDGPERLVAQQVVEHDDGSVTLLATDPDGREAWSLPLVTDTDGTIRPADTSLPDGEVQPAGTRFPGSVPGLGTVLDVVSLPDGSMLSLEASTDGGEAPFLRRTTFGPPGEDQVQSLPDLLWPNDAGFELDTGGGWQVTLHDGERGIVHRYLIDPDAAGDELLANSRGAEAAVAGVHVGSSPAAWDLPHGQAARQDALEDEELEALLEKQARVRAIAQEARASIADLEEQRDRAATDEAEALQAQLDELRAALAREQAELDAIAQEIAALRADAARRAEAEADADG